MKSTTYTRFCRRAFSKFFERFNVKETSKNRLLEKADICMVYKEYYSMVLMNLLVGFIASFVSMLILYLLIPHPITALLMLVISSVVPLLIAVYYITMPSSKAKARGKNIDLFLPYATNFINTMSAAGISPAEIFEALSTVKLYGEIQKEAKKNNHRNKYDGNRYNNSNKKCYCNLTIRKIQRISTRGFRGYTIR